MLLDDTMFLPQTLLTHISTILVGNYELKYYERLMMLQKIILTIIIRVAYNIIVLS